MNLKWLRRRRYFDLFQVNKGRLNQVSVLFNAFVRGFSLKNGNLPCLTAQPNRMAQPTVSSRQNTLRQPTADRPRANTPRPSREGSPTSRPRTRRPSVNWAAALDHWLTDQRSTLTLGVLLMGLAVGLFIAFVSYLFFNGSDDQSVVGAAFTEPLTESGAETRNWLGLTGAVVAHAFVFFAGLALGRWPCQSSFFWPATN